MKRFERYGAQLALLSEAAFVIVRREGPDALSRRGLAAELGASDAMARRTLADHVSLPTLAAQVCEARRRHGRHRLPVLDQLLPGPDSVDVAVVWLRLLLRHGTVPAVDRGVDLPHRYQLATRGWSDKAVPGDAPTGCPETDGVERTDLLPYLADHTSERQALVARLVGDRPELVAPVLALADGLVLAVCTGRLTATAARAVMLEHLRLLGVPHAA